MTSGADDSLINQDLVTQASVPTDVLSEPKAILGLNRKILAKITYQTAPWSVTCHNNCLHSALCPSSVTPDPSPEFPDLSMKPAEYHDLGTVYSKQHALSLPPHHPYDCGIDLLPGASLPSSWLYNLSWPEQEAMEEYIGESLATYLIRPSSSPVEAGFFFIQKKDSSLRPCIDYQVLNDITSKNKYPLPLLDAAFGPLHRAQIFSKLDLCNVYYLVRICEG